MQPVLKKEEGALGGAPSCGLVSRKTPVFFSW